MESEQLAGDHPFSVAGLRVRALAGGWQRANLPSVPWQPDAGSIARAPALMRRGALNNLERIRAR
jgi:hypothetical protein